MDRTKCYRTLLLEWGNMHELPSNGKVVISFIILPCLLQMLQYFLVFGKLITEHFLPMSAAVAPSRGFGGLKAALWLRLTIDQLCTMQLFSGISRQGQQFPQMAKYDVAYICRHLNLHNIPHSNIRKCITL